MNARQSPQRTLVLAPSPPQQIIPVAKAPGDQAESRDAEQRIEDLRRDLEPDLGAGIDGVVGRVGHGGRGMDEDQEEHAAPRYDVQSVQREQEAKGRDNELGESAQGDSSSLFLVVFGWELVAVSITECWVMRRDYFGFRGHRSWDTINWRYFLVRDGIFFELCDRRGYGHCASTVALDYFCIGVSMRLAVSTLPGAGPSSF